MVRFLNRVLFLSTDVLPGRVFEPQGLCSSDVWQSCWMHGWPELELSGNTNTDKLFRESPWHKRSNINNCFTSVSCPKENHPDTSKLHSNDVINWSQHTALYTALFHRQPHMQMLICNNYNNNNNPNYNNTTVRNGYLAAFLILFLWYLQFHFSAVCCRLLLCDLPLISCI